MRGYPQSFATKQDYLNSLQLYPEQTKSDLKRLLSSRFIWENQKELTDKKSGKNDETHQVLETEKTDEQTGKTVKVFIQQKKVEDKNSTLFRLGFSVKEVENLIVQNGIYSVIL